MKKILVIGLISSSLLLGGCFKEDVNTEVKKEIQENIQTGIIQTGSTEINEPIETNSGVTEITQSGINSEKLNSNTSNVIKNNISIDSKYSDIVDYIQSYKGIINEFTLGDNDIIRLSSINYNSSKDKAVYSIGTRFKGIDGIKLEEFYNENYFGAYGESEREVVSIIIFDKKLKTNKVVFIGHGRWHSAGGDIFSQQFTYNDGLITNENDVYINDISSYSGNILELENLRQFSFYDNIIIKGPFTEYILDDSNLVINTNFSGEPYLQFGKNQYVINNLVENKKIVFNYPYYKLKDDYNRLKKTKYFTENENIILGNSNSVKYDSKYAENISKSNKFELSVLYKDNLLEDTDENIIKNDKNKVILSIKDIDPKLINLSFETNANIGNINFNVFKITFKNKILYFVYDLKNQKGTIIDNKKDFSGFDKNGNIIFNNEILDIGILEFKEYVEINGL